MLKIVGALAMAGGALLTVGPIVMLMVNAINGQTVDSGSVYTSIVAGVVLLIIGGVLTKAG